MISGRWPSGWSLPGRAAVLRMPAWAAVMVTYLTLWSAGLGWTGYWWAWLFVLAPVVLSALRRPAPGSPRQAADGFVLPRVRFPTSHRRRRGTAR